jgi:hypothetical protein
MFVDAAGLAQILNGDIDGGGPFLGSGGRPRNSVSRVGVRFNAREHPVLRFSPGGFEGRRQDVSNLAFGEVAALREGARDITGGFEIIHDDDGDGGELVALRAAPAMTAIENFVLSGDLERLLNAVRCDVIAESFEAGIVIGPFTGLMAERFVKTKFARVALFDLVRGGCVHCGFQISGGELLGRGNEKRLSFGDEAALLFAAEFDLAGEVFARGTNLAFDFFHLEIENLGVEAIIFVPTLMPFFGLMSVRWGSARVHLDFVLGLARRVRGFSDLKSRESSI